MTQQFYGFTQDEANLIFNALNQAKVTGFQEAHTMMNIYTKFKNPRAFNPIPIPQTPETKTVEELKEPEHVVSAPMTQLDPKTD